MKTVTFYLKIIIRYVSRKTCVLYDIKRIHNDRKMSRGTVFGMMSDKLSRVVRKPAFCICENKDADQLRGSREADQRLCFRYIDSTIPLLSKYEISSL